MKKWIVLAMVTGMACSRLPDSVGRTRDIVVIAAQPDTALVAANLQITNSFPQPESKFVFLFASDTAGARLDRFHALFLYGSLQDTFISTLLSPEARSATRQDTFNLFKLKDLWARDQVVVVLAVREPTDISAGIARYAEVIRGIFDEHYYARVKTTYYEQRIDTKMRETLRGFGVTFDVPTGWILDTTYLKERFFSVHIHNPDRSVFVYKVPGASIPDAASAVVRRDEITRLFYNGDYALQELTVAEPIVFHEQQGLRLRGVWQNDSLVAGGPFITYFLTHDDTLYVLDALLFLPGQRKTEYLTGLEVLLNSYAVVHGN